MTNLDALLNQFSGMSYSDVQKSMALQSLQLIVQQQQQAIQQQTLASQQAQYNANQSLVERYLLAQDAILAQQDYIKYTRDIQDFQNTQYDRQYGSALQNILNLRRSQKINLEVGDKVASSRIGSATVGAAASGVVASEGSAKDITNQILSETQKDSMNTYRDSENRILQVQEQALSTTLQKALSNWTTEEQIKFGVKALEDDVRFI